MFECYLKVWKVQRTAGSIYIQGTDTHDGYCLST